MIYIHVRCVFNIKGCPSFTFSTFSSSTSCYPFAMSRSGEGILNQKMELYVEGT